jgi:hypothetical protein
VPAGGLINETTETLGDSEPSRASALTYPFTYRITYRIITCERAGGGGHNKRTPMVRMGRRPPTPAAYSKQPIPAKMSGETTYGTLGILSGGVFMEATHGIQDHVSRVRPASLVVLI